LKSTLFTPSTRKIISYDYLYSVFYENLSEGAQNLDEGRYWLILKDGKETLAPISKIRHNGLTCFVCPIMEGRFTSAQSVAKSYDALMGNQLATGKVFEQLFSESAHESTSLHFSSISHFQSNINHN
jgi:hypothetical protein